ncbi:MAG TPA: tripartite tricarboxylate transporter substrate binding protein [Burkholderiales bacterium]|nr:tripartite tricarboxylate transporter substrate binding protein [Burkholderiales bacterium]
MKIERPISAALALALGVLAAPAIGADAAKDYPDRPIRLLVPNAAGSSVDTLSRIIGGKLAEALGQQVVIDNRAGAGGIVGMELAKHANPDGYTLISATTAASTIAVLLQKNPTFHPVKDYDYVCEVAETPNVLVVNPTLPPKSVRELIDYTKSKPGQVNMASAGPGSQSHLSGAYLQQAGSFQSLHVPYKGGGPSVASVIANESQWTLTPAPAVMTFVNSGRLRALGHSLPKRSPLLGDIPPIAETIPGFDYSGWQGFFVPKNTPRPIVEKLRAAVTRTMESPEMKKALALQATEVVLRGPDEFRKVVADSMVKNAKVIQAVGLKAE